MGGEVGGGGGGRHGGGGAGGRRQGDGRGEGTPLHALVWSALPNTHLLPPSLPSFLPPNTHYTTPYPQPLTHCSQRPTVELDNPTHSSPPTPPHPLLPTHSSPPTHPPPHTPSLTVVSARLLAVELGACEPPHLGQEGGVVHPHPLHALLGGVEEANVLAVDVEGDAGVPGVIVLSQGCVGGCGGVRWGRVCVWGGVCVWVGWVCGVGVGVWVGCVGLVWVCGVCGWGVWVGGGVGMRCVSAHVEGEAGVLRCGGGGEGGRMRGLGAAACARACVRAGVGPQEKRRPHAQQHAHAPASPPDRSGGRW